MVAQHGPTLDGDASMGLVGAAIGGQSMMADATDEHELALGVRREALFFSGFMLAQKAASGIGGFLAGMSLDLIGFVPGKEQAALPVGLIRNLGLVAGPLPALVTLIAPLALIGYRLSRERHRLVLSALSERKTAMSNI